MLQGTFDAAVLPLARLRLWNDAESIDGTLGLWAWTLIGHGRASEALALLAGAEGVFARTACALAQAKVRGSATTGSSSAPLPDDSEAREREPLLYLLAARYRITHDAADLDRLLAATGVGERILPGLVPLAELPRSRPELGAAYPLGDVLASNWKEAIFPRLAEIAPLRLTLLGSVGARRDGSPVDLAPRLQAIVVLLALGQSREQIADALWPDLEPLAARNNLHVNLNKLRRTLEPWGLPTFLGEAGLVRTESDLAALHAAIGADDTARVLELYLGDLAPDLRLPVVDQTRERLRREVVAALARGAATAAPDLAEALLTRLLELDPLNESAVQALLRLLVAGGRRARAVKLFEQFREQLGAEVGARPLAATRAALD